jgi:hypothetical protein
VLELEEDAKRRGREEDSTTKSIKGAMHYLIMSSREYPRLRGPGCVIL